MSEQYISQLDVTTPPGTAFVSNADEVMRTIKTAVKQSFPNVGGAVTLTHTQVNALPGDITAAQTALKNILDPHGYTTLAGAAAATVVPKGGIIMWAPSMGAIPQGWRLCDGGTYNGVVTPDLRDRFVKCETTGFSGTRAVAESLATGGAHDHAGATGSTTLTISQIPAHSHNIAVREDPGPGNQPGNSDSIVDGIGSDNTSTLYPGVVTTQTVGGGQGHTHTIGSAGSHTHTGILPVHYILAFICYVGA